MKRFLLFSDNTTDIIECPDLIVDNYSYYNDEFVKWIYNPENDHGYWIIDEEGIRILDFEGDAFVDWLNDGPLRNSDEKARYVKRNYKPTHYEMNSMLRIYV